MERVDVRLAIPVSGNVKDENNEKIAKPGDALFIPSMEWHQFINRSDKVLKFLCLIPNKG